MASAWGSPKNHQVRWRQALGQDCLSIDPLRQTSARLMRDSSIPSCIFNGHPKSRRPTHPEQIYSSIAGFRAHICGG